MAETISNAFDFDTGLKTFTVNNNPDCTITFNPADALFLDKISTAANKFAQMAEEMDNSNTEQDDTKARRNMEKVCRDEINKIFEYDVCASVFNNVNITALGANGYPVAYNFLNALKKQCEICIQERAKKLKKNTKKYTSGYTDNKVNGSHNENIQSAPNS